MNIIKKIFILIVITLMILQTTIYGKYNYKYTLNAFSLNRDCSEIIYEITKSESDKKYTNKDVLLEINLNKPVEAIDGFCISEDRKKLSKTISQNENDTIIVEDISGNKKDITYNIDNIDKIPPEIIGIEDGKTYKTNKIIQYRDNVGIENIFVDEYSKLLFAIYPDYYDSDLYKGIDVTNTSIYVDIITHPQNTKYYCFYLNDILKMKTEDSEFMFTELSSGTDYEVKVEALDINGNVLDEQTQKVKTKYFSSITLEKGLDNVRITLKGIDSIVSKAYSVGFIDTNNPKYKNVEINSNRDLTVEFSAYEFGNMISDRYYYFHVNLQDITGNTLEVVCCNVIFGKNYIKDNEITDINNLTKNGNYQIVVTDYAGNKTEKNIIINKT